jgi:hypothetical protein
MFSSQATNSPSKLNVPSRKQRNQASSRVHDIEFATEIGTSLLSQVRQLQALLMERDEALKAVNLEKSKLELEAEGYTQRLRNLDESEQRYKDENWSLETQTHELMAAARDSTEREQKLNQSLGMVNSQKTSIQKELDELKQSHGKLNEDHSNLTKQHDLELSGLRRSLVFADGEKGALQRKIEDLNVQNQELAAAVAVGRSKQEEFGAPKDFDDDDFDNMAAIATPEGSPPPSPSKGTPRHAMLESETLKSSLHHAHRMIQNLKGNIHREKSEKVELKRMLQDAQNELEMRRGDAGLGAAAGSNGKRRKVPSEKDLFKKPAKPTLLGAGRNSKNEVLLDDTVWEDHHGESSPRRLDGSRSLQADAGAGSHTDQTSDAFETAHEKDTTATETEAFHTGAESLGGDSSEEMTETEEGANKANAKRPQGLAQARKRDSYLSTASTSNEEDNTALEPKTPLQDQPQRLRLKVNRGGAFRRSRASGDQGVFDSNISSMKNSPASFANSSPAGPPGQSLFAELGEFEGDSDEGEVLADGTPSRRSVISHGASGTSRPATANPARSVPTPVLEKKTEMQDSSTMTEPWKPEKSQSESHHMGTAAAGGAGLLAAGALLAHGRPHSLPQPDSPTLPLNGFIGGIHSELDEAAKPQHASVPAVKDSHSQPKAAGMQPLAARESAPNSWSISSITSQDIKPVSSPVSAASPDTNRVDSHRSPLGLSAIQTEETVPSQDVSKDTRAVEEESTPKSTARTGLLGSVFGWGTSNTKPQIVEDASSKPVDRSTTPPDAKEIQPFKDVSGNAGLPRPIETTSPPMALSSTEMADQGSQTILSSNQIDKLLKPKSPSIPLLVNPDGSKGSPSAQWRLSTGELNPDALRSRKSQDSVGSGSVSKARSKMAEQGMNRDEAAFLKTHRRPGSSGSNRSTSSSHPPLPADHKKAIAAAAQRSSPAESSTAAMGPPIAPASAYKVSAPSLRPRTPSEQYLTSPGSRGGTTPRARGFSARESPAGTRRSSVTSFASELDERFNIRTDGMSMRSNVADRVTDPRMIQAITQTMIGEYLWKYTRRAGRGEMSNNRHRRFFWIHPYTRTLYWSDKDPATAGRAQLKAKSVSIEAVRVVTDDNPMPPGLHRKSLIVVTPGRSVKFTATTGQRHETWFNALSYLLLRTSIPYSGTEFNDADSDLEDFDTGSRLRGRRGPPSLSSYNSRTTHNTDVPSRNVSNSRRARMSTEPEKVQQGSISRLSSYFRPGSSLRGSFSSKTRHRSMNPDIYEASEVHDSAEDLREVMDQQDKQADRLENVRACCDGESRQMSFFELWTNPMCNRET